jgi:hypothetical protein
MRRREFGDDDSLPVMVPRSDKALVAISPERVRRLREHLIEVLRELRTSKHSEHSASPMRPEPTGFAARVARAACSLCKGWCCRNGDDDAFLDDRTLARVRIARPDLDECAVLRLYLERAVYRGSCIFHGKRGCTLDRSLRADVCNNYFCGGLGAYMKARAAIPTRVIAGEGDEMRTFTGSGAVGDTVFLVSLCRGRNLRRLDFTDCRAFGKVVLPNDRERQERCRFMRRAMFGFVMKKPGGGFPLLVPPAAG